MYVVKLIKLNYTIFSFHCNLKFLPFLPNFQVDLVVAHVQSALLSVFELMKAYERQGLLAIRPGIRFPHHMDMPWDPNSETEWVKKYNSLKI